MRLAQGLTAVKTNMKEKNIDLGKILYIIMFNSNTIYRLANDLKAIQIVNEAG